MSVGFASLASSIVRNNSKLRQHRDSKFRTSKQGMESSPVPSISPAELETSLNQDRIQQEKKKHLLINAVILSAILGLTIWFLLAYM